MRRGFQPYVPARFGPFIVLLGEHAQQERGQRLRADAAADRRSALGDAGGVRAAFGWGWLVELLEDYGFHPHLVHPLRCKAIASARLKNDRAGAALLPPARPPAPDSAAQPSEL